METRYVTPGRGTKIFNGAVAGLTKVGVSVWGSRVLFVRGRSSGEWRSTPVNLLTHRGERYLVAPRGTTQWVRNLRAAGGQGELHLGRRVEPFRATELGDDAKPDVLRLPQALEDGDRRLLQRGGAGRERRQAPRDRPRLPRLPDRAGRLVHREVGRQLVHQRVELLVGHLAGRVG